MLVINTLDAPRAVGPRLRRAKARPVDPNPAPEPVPLSRVTMIRPRPFDGRSAAAAWLDRIVADRELSAALAAEAGQALNRAIHAHRTAAGDAHLADVDPARALAVRFGYGTGEELADGRWQDARELAERERVRLLKRDYEALRPQERVAAVLGGRERVGAHEELIVRARGDLDAGRDSTAVLGLSAALEALLAAPEGLPTQANESLQARLEDARREVASERELVLAGGEADPAVVERCLSAAEAAVRQRALE